MANQSFTVNIKALFDASDVKAKVGDIQSVLSKLKLPDKLTANLNTSFTNVNKALDDFISRTEKGVKSKADATGITKSFEAVTKELTNLDNLMIKVKSQIGDGVDLSKIVKIPDDVKNRIAELRKEIDDLQKQINNTNAEKLLTIEQALKQIKSGSGAAKQGQAALDLFKQGNVDGAIESLNKIITKLQAYQTAASEAGKNTKEVENSIKQLGLMRTAMEQARDSNASAYNDIGQKAAEAGRIAAEAQGQIVQKTNEAADALHKEAQGANDAASGINNLSTNQAQFVKEVDQVKSRIQYFFGLANSINLVKRAIHGAVDTVKELDKAMTETAVVTDHTVSDMWAKLPEYTKRANELGVSTLAAYQSATLYYQQGLNDEQAAALSTETLKMARIAGLEAADATDRMTNALRGFNMELNSTDAQRVDDVYSQLAAMSASNVDEISTAMTKVASLAHSANMEFETTAAFLAQIIETTRESAETAGTALKTVVARFSEVKKLVDTDQLKGTDEEGQVVDVNKVSTALRTAGIDLNKYFLGEVGLDDIFMELASKWDSLTSVQQRYIATQAAGSRQQSRFIALMQDYARTQQLVSAAYNANGASARQFEKTQESLQSKLARLKNAWDAFLMGLANNAIIKGAVDLLTLLLNTVNNLTSAFGNGIGTILKWVAAISGFVGLKSAFGAGGIATRAIGSLVGNTPIGNAIKGVLGVTATGAEGGSSPVARQPVFFGSGGLIDKIGTEIKGFKANNAYTAKQLAAQQALASYQAMDAEALGMGATGYSDELAYYSKMSGKPAKTLFGALGNRFVDTSIGGALQSKLGALPKIGSAFTGAAGGAATLGVALAGVAAAAGLVYAAWRASPQGQLKTAQKQAEKAREEAQEAQNELKTLTTLQDTYKEKTEVVNETTTVSDRAQAIKDRNDAILNAIKEDGTLAQYVITEQVDNEIILRVDEAGLAKAAEEATKIAEEAAIKSYFREANVGVKEANVARNSLEGILTGTGLFDASYIAGKTVDEIYQLILQNSDTLSDKQLSKAAELYSSYNASIGSAEQQVRLGYGKSLAAIGASDDLTNALIPVLSKMWLDTGKQVSDASLTTLTKQRGLSPILSAINGEDKLTEIALTDEVINNRDQLLGSLGISEEALSDFATALGISTKDIYAQIKASAKQQKEIQKQNQATIFQSALSSGIKINKDVITDVKSMEPQITAQVAEISNAAQEAMSQKGFKSLMEQMISGGLNTKQLQEIQSFYNNFNLDNPIQAFHQLRQAQDEVAQRSDTDPFKGMLSNINQANKEIFNTGNLIQTFITSTSYDSLTDSLDKFIEANDRITSENIEELADSCSELQYLLEDTELTVQGLAEAFTLLETGAIAFDALTTSLLMALSAGESFEGLIDNVSNWIKDFSEGTDLTEGTDHIVDVVKKASEYIEGWQFGNEPLENIYDHLFGEGAFNKYMSSNYPDKGFDQIEADLKNKVDQVSSWAENEGLGALQSLANGYGGGLTGLTQLDDEGLQFEWDLSQFETTKDAIQAVGTALGVTDDAARAFIESWGSHMWDLRQDWNNLNFGEQMQGFAKELGDGVIITKAELDGLSAATGKTSDEIVAELQKIKGESYIPIIVDWQDSNGANLTGQALFDQFDKIFKTFNPTSLSNDFSQFLNGIIDGADIDATQLMNKLTSELKMSDSQASEVADHIIQSTGGKLTKEIEIPVVTKLEEGSFEVTSESITIEAGSMSDLTAAADAALEAANAQMIGDMLANNDYAGLTSAVTGALESGGTAGAAAVQSALNAISIDIPVSWHWTNGPPSTDTGATGGVVKSYASGSANNSLSPGVALTGEEGPEIVWNKDKGYAYITGEQHPEFRELKPGDRVFNTQETKKILNGAASGGLVDSFASGGWKPPSSSSKSGGGSSGGSGKGSSGKDKTPEEWKNDLDWLYNLMEDIAELERDQKAIEEQYEDYLSDQTKTGGDLYRLLVKQLGNLYTQLNHQTFALEKREQEMREFMDITNDQDQYLWYNWEDRTLEIDWDAIDQITDEEQYKHVKELIDEAEEIQDKIDDADDSIMDITNQIQELENIWRDTFIDFEDRVLDAIIKSYQQIIDNYNELNDTLNNSNTQILDSLQKQISLERQIRDNTKTEEEISDEEARLAYLRRDTSGGNELAALQLERELADQRESYEDTLVDQAISRLQEDNDAAAQQRERQIEIMQAQLDYQSENGEFNAYISELLTAAMGADGELLTNSDLVTLLKEQENWDAMSAVSKQVWDEELNGTFKEVAAFLLKENAEQNGTYYTALTAAVNSVSSAIGSYSQAMVKLGNTISSIGSSGGYSGGSSGGGSSGDKSSQSKPIYHTVYRVVNGTPKYYATGGLNTQTGPAWLDGTPSEPEYVLNARQTDAFLKLADVLPSVMNGTSTTTSNTFGATYVNLSVNLESVSPDYDVDRMVDLVKDRLYDAGSYRNVNSLSFLR